MQSTPPTKIGGDNTVVGLISNGDKTAYRDKLWKVSTWCSGNNLTLNTKKTITHIIDVQKSWKDQASLFTSEWCVEFITFKFLGIHLSADLSWTINTKVIVKKAPEWMQFLRVLEKQPGKEDARLPSTAPRWRSCSCTACVFGCVVSWLHSRRQESTTESAKHCTKKYYYYIQVLLPSAGPRPQKQTSHIQLTNCLNCCSLGGVTGKSNLTQPDFQTAVSLGPYNWQTNTDNPPPPSCTHTHTCTHARTHRHTHHHLLQGPLHLLSQFN